MNAVIRLGLLAVPGLLLSLLFWQSPDFLISSDTLLPAAFTWGLLHVPGSWGHFQLARVPSLFPDVFVLALVQMMTESWRIAIAVWVAVMIAWLTVVAAAIIRAVAMVERLLAARAAVIVVMGLLGMALVVQVCFAAVWGVNGQVFPFVAIILPVSHGGPFLLALTAGVVANHAIGRAQEGEDGRGRWGSQLALFALSLAGVMSDLLYVGSLLIPLTLILVVFVRLGRLSRAWAIRLAVGIWSGGALGLAVAQALMRQPTPLPSLGVIPWHIGLFLQDLGQYPIMLLFLDAVLLLLIADIWRRGWHDWLGTFWSLFAACGVLGSLAVTMMIYNDLASYRYAFAYLWLPPILLGAELARIVTRRPAALRLPVGLLVAALALGVVGREWQIPRLLVWDTSLAKCLETAGLRAGIAEYWTAGRTSAATDWRVQMAQLNQNGVPKPWGNDFRWFVHDIHDWSRRAKFNFIVMQNLADDQIAAAYGRPDRVLGCGSIAVWIYDDPDHLWHALARHAPELRAFFAAAPAE